MLDEPESTAAASAKPDRLRSRAVVGAVFAILIVGCALVAWKFNGPKQASGMSVTVNTTVPPDTPPINPPAKKE
jgi:hypothetical protein